MSLAAIDRLRPSRQRRPPSVWRTVGLVSAALLAVTSWFCASTPAEFRPLVWPGIQPLRPDGGSPLACSFAILAAAGIVYSWWAIRDLDVSIRWLRVTGAIWGAPLLLSASLYSRDVFSYAAQGLMLHVGLDPYHQGVSTMSSPWVDSVSRVWLDTPAPYGPLFLVLARFAAAVSGGHQLVALVLLRLCAVAGVLVTAWAVPVIARALGTDARRATWLGVITPIVGGHFVSGAHNDALMVAGMTASLALALRRHHAWAVLAASLAISIKAPAVLVVPFLALLWAADRERPAVPSAGRLVLRSAGYVVLTGLVFVVISLATGLGFAWVDALETPGLGAIWVSPSYSWAVFFDFFAKLGGVHAFMAELAVSRTVALVLMAPALVVVWLDAARHALDRRHVVRSAGVALMVFIVLSPAFHGWYYLWALPVLAASLVSARALTWLALVAALLSFAELPAGYSLGLTFGGVGAPVMAVGTILAAVWGVRQALRLPRLTWREMVTVVPTPQPEPAGRRT